MSNFDPYLQRDSLPSELEQLSESALNSFIVLEPWCQAKQSSHHPLVTSTVEGIKKLAQQYGKAINASLNVAQKGNCFSEYAIELCRHLRQDQVDQVHAHRLLRAMEEKAEEVHRDAGDMYQQFRDLSRDITFGEPQIRQEHGAIVQDFISLPIPLRNLKEGFLAAFQHMRVYEKKSISQAQVLLEQATKDLGELAEQVSQFVDWWGNMKMSLASLIQSINLVQLDGSNPLRTIMVESSWAVIKNACIQYQLRINVLKDYFPEVVDHSPNVFEAVRGLWKNVFAHKK